MPNKKLLVITVEKILLLAVWDGAKIEPDYVYNDSFNRIWIFLRPGLREFLDFCFEHFHVGLWSEYSSDLTLNALHHIYGDCGDTSKLEFLLTTDDLVPVSDNRYDVEGMFRLRSRCKSINVIIERGYPLEDIIIVDDDPKKWEPYGQIPRESWALTDDMRIGFGSVRIGHRDFDRKDRSILKTRKKLMALI